MNAKVLRVTGFVLASLAIVALLFAWISWREYQGRDFNVRQIAKDFHICNLVEIDKSSNVFLKPLKEYVLPPASDPCFVLAKEKAASLKSFAGFIQDSDSSELWLGVVLALLSAGTFFLASRRTGTGIQ